MGTHTHTTSSITLTDEILKYQQLALGCQLDVVDFWRINSTKLPALSLLARTVFAIAPTSAESERNFNISGDLLCVKRANLNPEKCRKSLFIHSNIKLL